MKKLWLEYTRQPWEKKILVGGGLLALLPILLSLLLKSDEPAGDTLRPTTHHRTQVDTYIPKGFVLVPIEVQNYEALDSILGQFGLVDLLQTATPENPRPHLVARHVRILRAPQNPSHFAVLVQESETANILKFGSQFTVLVRRPDAGGTEFVKTTPPRPIVYEGE